MIVATDLARPLRDRVAALRDVHAEREVLGGLLLEPGTVGAVRAIIEPRDFGDERHAVIYAALLALDDAGTPIDSVTLRDRLASSGRLDRAGGDEMLLSLGDTIPTVANITAHAAIVREKAQLRHVRDAHLRGIAAAEAGWLDDAHEAACQVVEMQAQTRAPAQAVAWRGVTDLFAPLPPTNWRSKGLQMCPGRPAALIAYGSGAKSLSAQSMGLSVAAGQPIWGHFDCHPGTVKHFDYEQGWHGTAKRYQRLAYGMGIDPREIEGKLLVAVFPELQLTAADAVDAYARECEGADLVILDALRGAVIGINENDSIIRNQVDVLTKVSERTGTTFLLLHHGGKPKEGHTDKRTVTRGSSAIFDGLGCALLLENPKDKGEPRRVTQIKAPAEAEGGEIDPFGLRIVDEPATTANPLGGVRVVWEAAADDHPAGQTYDRDAARVHDLVRANRGATKNALAARSGMGKQRLSQLLDVLAEEGRVCVLPGPRGAQLYYPEPQV